jgi:hypothetical protein
MIKELLNVTFPNNRTTTYCKVLQNILREQHDELKGKSNGMQSIKGTNFFVFLIKRCKQTTKIMDAFHMHKIHILSLPMGRIETSV